MGGFPLACNAVIKEFFIKRRFRKLFKNSLSPQVTDKLVDQILNGSIPDKPELKEASIEFVCVSVQGETPEIIAERMAIASDIAIEHKGMIQDQVSGIIIITYGILFCEPDDAEQLVNLCQSLQTKLAGNVKIVYGKAQGHFGNLGSSGRMSFSFILPSFLDALATLAALPYGEIREFKDK